MWEIFARSLIKLYNDMMTFYQFSVSKLETANLHFLISVYFQVLIGNLIIPLSLSLSLSVTFDTICVGFTSVYIKLYAPREKFDLYEGLAILVIMFAFSNEYRVLFVAMIVAYCYYV